MLRKGTVALAAAAVVLAVAGAPNAVAAGFETPRYVVDQRGDLTVIGNTILGCNERSPACRDARKGKGERVDNNDHDMSFIDVDDDKGTFNSSSADLKLPVAGSEVTFAGLYWAGDLRNTKGKSEKRPPDEGKRNRVLLAAPGAGYVPIGTGGGGELQHENTRYVGFSNVTEIVQAAGAGRYTVAEIQVAEGDFGFGGWHMVVAWRDPEDPLRNITVFDGIRLVGKQGKTDVLEVPISGFRTLPAGNIKAKLLTVGLDGDLGRGGDRVRFEKKILANKVNPGNNYFNSSISDAGKHSGDKQPDLVNQLGYDIDSVGVTNLLDHDQTKGLFDFRTDADRFSPTLFAFRIDTVIPDMTIDKASSGSFVAGRAASYQLVATNAGTEATTEPVTVTDSLPAGVTPTGATGEGWLCSIAGQDIGCSRDDPAGFGAAYPPITIPVAVSPSAPSPLTNEAAVAGGGESNTLNNTDSVTDPVAHISDLAIVKGGPPGPVTAQGANITYALTVSNAGPSEEAAPVVSDQLPPEVIPISATPSSGSCGFTGKLMTCALGPLGPGATATIDVVVDVDDAFNCGQTITNVATIGGAGQDPVAANNKDGHSFVTVPNC